MFTKYIGIDMSTSSPGVCVLNKDGDLLRTWTSKKRLKVLHSSDICYYDTLADSVCLALGIKRPMNTMILIEDYAPAARGQTNKIAECTGILKYKLLFDQKVPAENIKLCSIQHLKMFAVGKGNCKKELVIKEVYKKWGFDTNSNDIADAFVLAKMAFSIYSGIALQGKHLDVCNRVLEYNKKHTI